MPETQYLKTVHPTPDDHKKYEEWLVVASIKEPQVGPLLMELRTLIKKYPKNELFYWKMATLVMFMNYKRSEEQLLKISMGQPTQSPQTYASAPVPTSTQPPRKR